MQIILLEKIANLGNLGDVVKVKDGYARNFLIPRARARRATEDSHQGVRTRRADLEKAAAEKLAAAQALHEQLSGKIVRISQKAGVDGRLFGSVTNPDIAEGLTKMGFAILKSQVRMPNGPLKVDWRARGVGVAAHRRRRRRHRAGGRRSRLSGSSTLTARPVATGLFHCAARARLTDAANAWTAADFHSCAPLIHRAVHRAACRAYHPTHVCHLRFTRTRARRPR